MIPKLKFHTLQCVNFLLCITSSAWSVMYSPGTRSDRMSDLHIRFCQNTGVLRDRWSSIRTPSMHLPWRKPRHPRWLGVLWMWLSLWLSLLPLCISTYVLIIYLLLYDESNMLWRILFYLSFFSLQESCLNFSREFLYLTLFFSSSSLSFDFKSGFCYP